MFLYICERCVFMFSEKFMRYLMNYQKSEFAPAATQKEIRFKHKGGKAVRVTVEVKSK